MKKFLSLLLVVVLTASLAVGGTLAYLTDRDSKANVFTVGDVSIVLNEKFDQGATLIPGVNIEKEPTITNTGKNDAWVWAEIAIPSALNNTTSASGNAIHFNMSAASVADGLWNWWDGDNYSEGAYMVKKDVEIDGVNYDIYTVQYETALKSGETTAEPVIYKVYLDPHVDIDPEGNWAWIENGNVTSIDWNSNTNPNPVIYVSAYAVQVEGFADVYAAYDAYQAQWGTKGGEYADPATVVSEAEDVTTAFANGSDVIVEDDVDIVTIDAENGTVNGNGSTVVMKGEGEGAYGYLSFNPGTEKDIVVSNVNVTGSGFVEVGHHGQKGGDYTVTNLNVTGMTTTVCVNEGGNNITAAFSHYGKAELNNCVMVGTESIDPAYTAYDAAFVNGTKTTINGGEYGKIYLAAQAHVTITNAEIDTIDSCAITTRNLGKLTIGAGATVGTINLTPTGNYKPALVIEDGATVGAIVYKGVTYTVAEWANVTP